MKKQETVTFLYCKSETHLNLKSRKDLTKGSVYVNTEDKHNSWIEFAIDPACFSLNLSENLH